MTVHVVGDRVEDQTLLHGLSQYDRACVYVEYAPDDVRPGDIVVWLGEGDPSVVKADQKAAILVVAQRDRTRELADTLDTALSVKANLIIDFGPEGTARLLDPLGNCFVPYTDELMFVACKAVQRAKRLAEFGRIGSRKVGEGGIHLPPDDEAFYSLVRNLAVDFDHLIPRPASRKRSTGNASFRCQRGFPGLRGKDGLLFVSRRNVDKSSIDKNGFVAVEPATDGPVLYYGPDKPSVDTPVQRELFALFPQVNYIVHGHVYVVDAPFTRGGVPCGALEEVDEILAVQSDRNKGDFAVNLRGHGCVLFMSKIPAALDTKFESRPGPEPA